MTAARSDLMELAEIFEEIEVDEHGKCDWTAVANAQAHLRAQLRLAASQPDREAVARTICQKTPDCKFGEGVCLQCQELTDAILSLLSGAGTKPDGRTRDSLSSEENEPVVTRACGPSDPSPGPDVKPAPIADSSEAGRGDNFSDLREMLRRYETAHDGDLAHYADVLRDWLWDNKERIAALSAPVGEPVAFTNEAQLSFLKNPEYAEIPMAMWAKRSGARGDIPLYRNPPAPAVGPDVREALGESSQTLEYLRREARTWGKIFSVNVDHVLDKNRKALSALTRPLGGLVQGSIARKQSTDPEGSSRTETAGANVRLFVECARCGGAGFSSPGTGYDNVCSECGGLRFIPFEAAGKRPVPSVSGNTDREQQRDTMGVTAGETAPNSPAVAETRRAGSAGCESPEVFPDPAPSRVEER